MYWHPLASWANIDAQESQNFFTALHRAAERGHLDIVKCLIQNKAHIMAELLVEHGANLEARGLMGHVRTPLYFAIFRQVFVTVKFLLEKGANIEAIEKQKILTAAQHPRSLVVQ